MSALTVKNANKIIKYYRIDWHLRLNFSTLKKSINNLIVFYNLIDTQNPRVPKNE